MRRDRGGQGELKSCTAPGNNCRPQTTAMRLDDRPTNGQAHTGPVILGRKECFEDLVRLLRRQSHARIPDRDPQSIMPPSVKTTNFLCETLREDTSLHIFCVPLEQSLARTTGSGRVVDSEVIQLGIVRISPGKRVTGVC